MISPGRQPRVKGQNNEKPPEGGDRNARAGLPSLVIPTERPKGASGGIHEKVEESLNIPQIDSVALLLRSG